jgi:hypothetical protein
MGIWKRGFREIEKGEKGILIDCNGMMMGEKRKGGDIIEEI